MPVAEEIPFLSPDEYLDWEKAQPLKHEYVDGQVFAMAGANDTQVTVTINLASMFRNHVRGGPCRVFAAEMKVRVPPEGPFYYPDIVVTCDERDLANQYSKAHPTVIVEVLSDTTAAFDRGKKFADYRGIESLKEYVLVETDRKSVECFRKDAQGRWVLYPFGPDGEVELESLGFRCSTAAVYEDARVP